MLQEGRLLTLNEVSRPPCAIPDSTDAGAAALLLLEP